MATETMDIARFKKGPPLILLAKTEQAKVIHDIIVPHGWTAGVLPHQYMDDKGSVIANLINRKPRDRFDIPGIFRGYFSPSDIARYMEEANNYPGSTVIVFAHESLITDDLKTLQRGLINIPHYQKTESGTLVELPKPLVIAIYGTGQENPSLEKSFPPNGQIIFNIRNGAGIPLSP